MSKILFTSESVTEGHPDKVCDRISDAVLDEVMKHDPNGRVACETCCTTGMVLVMGEISTEHYIDFAGIARGVLKDIGYDSPKAGFDGNTCAVMVAIDEQSPDIAMGTNDGVGGAGDQGGFFRAYFTIRSSTLSTSLSLPVFTSSSVCVKSSTA